MFILDRIDRSWTPLCQTLRAQIWLKFSECFDSIPLRILLDVLFRLFRFSKASFYACPGIFIHDILKLRRHLDTETYGKLPWQFCNFTCEITNYRWNFAPKLRSYSSPMIHESAKQNWKNKNCYRHHSSSQRSLSPVWFQLLTIFSSFMARVFLSKQLLVFRIVKIKITIVRLRANGRATMLAVVACVFAVVCKRMQQLPTILGSAVHRAKETTHKSL